MRNDTEALIASLEGRTITRAQWHGTPPDDIDGGDFALLTLDDGRKIEFGGHGIHTPGCATVDEPSAWHLEFLESCLNGTELPEEWYTAGRSQ